MLIATLCHIIWNNRLLLQKKADGLFGAGKWNGVGGKVLSNETPDACVRREVFEETGLTIFDLQYHGALNFAFGAKEAFDMIVHIFSTRRFEGHMCPNDEGVLRWFSIHDIPYDEMWVDDYIWLPQLLAGKQFQGTFYFDTDGTQIINYVFNLI